MTASNFAPALVAVLKHEGGYSNHPKDPGGATNRGITLDTFRRYVKPGASVSDLKRITDAEVAEVYRRFYWESAVNADDLPDGLDFCAFDFAVNSGPDRAGRYIQRIVGVKQDGKIGPITLAAVRAMPVEDIINRLCDDRLAFLRQLTTWGTFGKGWTNRIRETRRASLEMAAAAPVTPHPPDDTGVKPGEKPKRPSKWAAFLVALAEIFSTRRV